MSDPIDFAALAAPFDPAHLDWRVGTVAKNHSSCTLLAYLTARAVMDRLDEVCGPENWQNEYRDAPGSGILCGLSVRVNGEWVTKWDGAEQTQIEAVKGGLSGAMKRAAVQWGVGRYLYGLDTGWSDVKQGWANGKGVDVSADRKHVGWVPTPRLPSWALPADGAPAKPLEPAERTTAPKEPADEPVSDAAKLQARRATALERLKGTAGAVASAVEQWGPVSTWSNDTITEIARWCGKGTPHDDDGKPVLA